MTPATVATAAATLAITAGLGSVALPAMRAPAPRAAEHSASSVIQPLPCPVAPVSRPPISPSPMPQHDPSRPTIGGDALASAGLVVPSPAPPLPTVVSAKSWLVADLDTGAVLAACGAHEYGAPASVQKLLLAAVVMPKLNPTDMITVTTEDMNFEKYSSSVGLVKDGVYSVQTLWLGLLLQSGNDAANVLARVGGGSAGVAGTIAAMNDYARYLGALDTHAETPHGLDGPGQATSAYDLALIARVDFGRSDFLRYVATKTAQIPAQPALHRGGFQIQNQNKLLSTYPGALGGKTGFTDIARHTFVGVASRNGRRLVVTLLGAEQRPVRTYQQAAALLTWGFAVPAGTAPVGRLVAPGEVRLQPSPSPTPSPIASPPVVLVAPSSGPAVIDTAAFVAILTAVAGVVALRVRRRTRRDLASVAGTTAAAPSVGSDAAGPLSPGPAPPPEPPRPPEPPPPPPNNASI